MHRLLPCLLLAGCFSADRDPTDTNEAPVQLDRSSMFRVALDGEPGAKGVASRATGAVFTPLGTQGEDGTDIVGTCGVTFVSAGHALTAGHCVDNVPSSTILEVKAYAIAADSDWQGATNLQGNFPNWSHGVMGPGYQTTSYQCSIKARCTGAASTNFNCPFTKADIALLHCAGTPGYVHGYLDIADVDDQSASLEMPWKHEIYDINENQQDEYDHYTFRDEDHLEDNFHYFGEGRNSLVPLLTTNFPGNVPHAKLGISTDPSNTVDVGLTDLLGCHGTSGSGILQWNAGAGEYEFLGPVSVGVFSPPEELCQTPANHAPGELGMGYSLLDHAQELEDMIDDCAQPFDSAPTGFNLMLWLKCHRIRLPLLVKDCPLRWDPCPLCPAFDRLRAVNEPMVHVARGMTTRLPGVKVVAGARYRLAFRTFAGDTAPAAMALRLGTDTLAARIAPRIDVPATHPQWGVVALSFVARTTGVLSLDITPDADSGWFDINEIVVVRDGATLAFDNIYDRSGVVEMNRGGGGIARWAAFGGDGRGGYSAMLPAGRRLVLARQALQLGQTLDVTFRVAGDDPSLVCGLVHANGSQVTTPCAAAGGLGSARLTASRTSQPLGFFIERTGTAAVELESLTLAGL